MNNEFSFTSLLHLVKRNFKLLTVLVIISGLAGAFFSGPTFIRPKYKSTMAVFPLNIVPVSIESETEQVQQFFLATSIKDSVIKNFDLYKHWDIDIDGDKAQYWMDIEYQANVSVSRSQYESIVIKVLDYSPDTAKFIADEILKQYNTMVQGFWKTKGEEYMIAANRAIDKRSRYIDSLQQRLEVLSKEYGILEYEMQTKEVTKSYYEMLRGGASDTKMKEVSIMLDNLKNYGPEFLKISRLLKEYMYFYSQFVDKRDNYYWETQADLRFYNLVEEAKVAVKKSYPVRWVIVVSTIMATLFLALILLAQFDRPKS